MNLVERSVETSTAWLRRHPEIDLVSRDRGKIFREAATDGAPEANPTVVDGERKRFDACNGIIAQELDEHGASTTKPGGKQTREVVCQRDERTIAEARQY